MPRSLVWFVVGLAVASSVAVAGYAVAQESTPTAAECAVFVSAEGDAVTWSGVGPAITEPDFLRSGNVVLTVSVETVGAYSSVRFFRFPGEGIGPRVEVASKEARTVETFRSGGMYVLQVDVATGVAWTVTADWG